MKRLTESELLAIIARYEKFSGPEAERMKFAEYSALYDQFVHEDLPKIIDCVRCLPSLRDGRRGR